MHKFLVMVNSFSIWIFTCVAFAALHSCFCWGNTGSRDSSWKNRNWCVCVCTKNLQKFRADHLYCMKMFFETWRYAKCVLQFQMVSALLQKVEFSLVCQGGCRGTALNIDYLMLNCNPEMLKQHLCRAVFSKLRLRPKWLLFLLRNGLNMKFQH